MPDDDQQCVDDELELPVREALEDAQAEPGAEHGGRNESRRLPIQLRLRVDDDGRIRWIAISVTGCMPRMKG